MTRHELRYKAMTILYQAFLYDSNNIEYDVEHIRNAFVHGRWICNRIGNDKYYVLYDDEDLLVMPSCAYFKKSYSYQELYKLCNKIKDDYIISKKSSNSNYKVMIR